MPARQALFVTGYPLAMTAMGGGAWVDKRVVAQLAEAGFAAEIFAVADPRSTAPVPLEVRSSLLALAKVAGRMAIEREPYGQAKFCFSGAWGRRAEELRRVASSGKSVIASQFPSLLLCNSAGIAPSAYIAHNVEAQLARQHNPRILERLWHDSDKLERLELRLLKSAGKVLALSQHDMRTLQHASDACVLRLPLLTRGVAAVAPSQKSTAGIGFIGKFAWPPNRDAAKLLVETVYPQVRRMAPCPPLVLAGRGSERYADQQGVVAMGEVEDTRHFYAAISVVVIPRLGASTGVSVKILEALEAGVEVVAPTALATAAGLEQRVHTADTVDAMVQVLGGLILGRLRRLNDRPWGGEQAVRWRDVLGAPT